MHGGYKVDSKGKKTAPDVTDYNSAWPDHFVVNQQHFFSR